FVAGLFIPQIIKAQGTLTYMSNLAQPSTGNKLVGSNSWVATEFQTGANTGGYMLNSVQLEMADASGSPNGFTIMLYSPIVIFGPDVPQTNIDTLSGSIDPSTADVYTYTDA